MADFQGKKVGILGLGEENLALLGYLEDSGAEITICDKRGEGDLKEQLSKLGILSLYKLRFGPDYLENLKDFDIIFRTPGLPYLNSKIQQAKKAGVKISSQTKLFFELCPCPIIGVTGTKGKGTTSSLVYEILKRKSEARNPKHETNLKIQNSKSRNISDCVPKGGFRISDLRPQVFLGGNIGNPPIGFVDKLTKDDLVVLELSSFQLQDMGQSPHVAVILDIKVDHLDYHQNEAEYRKAKENIVRFQSRRDCAVINADYLTSIEFAASTPAQVFWFSRRKSVDAGAWVKNDKEIFLRVNDRDNFIVKTEEVILRGAHNLENICAAAVTAYLAGAKIEVISEVVKKFKGLEHRLEFVAEIEGVKFYNDSFSTTPDTTIAAIKSFSEPIILLIGGSSKKADYSSLAQEISNSSVKKIINIGETGKEIIDLIDSENIDITKDIQEMPQAIDMAKKIAQKGDVILLSPASASFDQFKNYKERGNIFKEEVAK